MAIGSPSQLGLVISPRAPKTTAGMMADSPDVIAAIDGPMFSLCTGQPSGYQTYNCGSILYRHLDASSGVDVPSRYQTRGITIGVADGTAYAERGATVRPGSRCAVQLYPSMIFAGANEASETRDTDPTIRAAVGILSDGRVFVAVSSQMGIRAMASVLLDMGATHAGYTDGGGSGALFVRSQNGSPEVRYNTTGRRVIAWVTLGNRTATGSLMSRGKFAMDNAIGATIPLSPGVLLAGVLCIVIGVGILIATKKE